MTQDSKKGDIYFKLMIAQITILIAMFVGMTNFILNQNKQNLSLMESMTDIQLTINDEYHWTHNVYERNIIPSYNLSIHNEKSIFLLKKNLHSIDSTIKVNTSNLARIYDYIRGKEGLTFNE